MTTSVEKSATDLGLTRTVLPITDENKHRFIRLYSDVPRNTDHRRDLLRGVREFNFLLGIPAVISMGFFAALQAWLPLEILGAVEGTLLLGSAATVFAKIGGAKVADRKTEDIQEAVMKQTHKAVLAWLLKEYNVVPARGELTVDYMDQPAGIGYSSSSWNINFKAEDGNTYAIAPVYYADSPEWYLTVARTTTHALYNSEKTEDRVEWFTAPLRSQALVSSFFAPKKTTQVTDQPFNKKNMKAYLSVVKKICTLEPLDLSTENKYFVDRARTDLDRLKQLRADALKLNPNFDDPKQISPILLTLQKELQAIMKEEAKQIADQLAVEETYILSR